MQEPAPTGRMTMLGFLALAAAMGIGRFAITPLLPMMRAENLLSVATAGWLATVHFLGYAMGALLARYLRGAPRLVLFLSLVVVAVSTLAMGTTENLAVWMVARWIAGACSAFVLVVVSSHIVRSLALAKRSDLNGLVFAGVGGGIAVIGLLIIGLMALDLPSWSGWTICGILSLSVAGLVLGGLPETGDQPARSPKGSRSPVPIRWRLILPYGVMGFGYVIPATYLPIMAQAAVSSELDFAWSWPIFGAAAAISTVVAARVASRVHDRTIWFASQLVMAVGLLLPALWPHLIFVVLGGICVGGTFMVITMAGMKEAHRFAGKHDAIPLIAAMTVAFAIGQIVGPSVAGMVYEASGSFGLPLILASGCLAVSAFMLLGADKSAVCTEAAATP